MSSGYIYILNNPAFEYIKIGQTSRLPKDRASEIYTTGTPFPFSLVHYEEVSDPISAEKMAHNILAKYRVNSNREFFNISILRAIEVLSEVKEHFQITTNVARLYCFRLIWLSTQPPWVKNTHVVSYIIRVGATHLQLSDLIKKWPEKQTVIQYSEITENTSNHWLNYYTNVESYDNHLQAEAIFKLDWGWYFESKTVEPIECNSIQEVLVVYKSLTNRNLTEVDENEK